MQAFVEPLRPVAAGSDNAERANLSLAIKGWLTRTVSDDFSTLEGFISVHPNSVWTPSLRLNLGRNYYQKGWFSKAMAAWKAAWDQTREMTEPDAVAIANAAVAEYAVMLARIGRTEELAAVLAETSNRVFQDSTLILLDRARDGLKDMRNRPGMSFRCGPYALNLIHTYIHGAPPVNFMENIASPPRGFSLTELRGFAQTGLNTPMQVAKRTPGAELILPSVVHWKIGHYGALIREQDGSVYLKDPTFGNDTWMSKQAIDDESSGYFLVPAGPLPAGWTPVGDAEAGTIYGKGMSTSSDTKETSKCSKKSKSGCDNGMATYSFHSLLASLHISDTPLSHSPARGPAVNFTVAYNMREYGQPTSISYSNFSPQWVSEWVSYLEDDPTSPAADVTIYLRGGGSEIHTGYNATTGLFTKNVRWDTTLARINANTYERRYPDGSKDVYARAIGTTGPSRKVFLSQVVDPIGNTVVLNYDTNVSYSTRLSNITDATGLVTTLGYTDTTWPYLITSVTDPFGRVASFSYQTVANERRLVKITDTIGIESNFEYNVSGQVNALVTPYGRTTFDSGNNGGTTGLVRWVQAQDSQGDIERLEFHNSSTVTGSPTWLVSPDTPTVPGITFSTYHGDNVNTFYWDKKAWATAPGDFTKAHLTHWCTTDGYAVASGVPHSEKPAFENRIWYRYPGQTNGYSWQGTSAQPSTIARIIEDGNGGTATQIDSASYNALGNLIQTIDPVGRTTSVDYDTNGIDPTAVKQKIGGVFQTLQSLVYDPTYPAHRPKSVTDASGQTTTLTYNTNGQILTVTNAKNETTTLTYGTTTTDPLHPLGRVYQIAGPQSGSTTTLTYDGYERPRTVTDSSGFITTYDYDAFNRVTLITFPDATTEQFVYDRLDLIATKDRQGRWSRTWYNSLRQPILTADALGQATQYQWCKCGAMSKLVDPKGQVTSWKHDAQARVTEKTYPDGRKETPTYQLYSGRLNTSTDAKGQVKSYNYNLDGSVKSYAYFHVTTATPGASFIYDPDFPRPIAMTDGTGTTAYTYRPLGQLGALAIATIDGPLAGQTDLITYTYDELGRGKTRNIGPLGTENLVTLNYDNLGRMSSTVNNLGSFGYSYVGATDRLDYVNFPNGQKTSFDYFPAAGDYRLKTINHLASASNPASTISRYDYTFSPDGSISTWQRQFGSDPATQFTLGYDLANQLTSANVAPVANLSSITQRYSYQYDSAGNRISQQIGNQITSATHNNANQITSTAGGGKLLVAGNTNKPARVTVNSKPATVTPPPQNLYQAWIDVTPGANTITVAATDYAPTPNTNTKSWSVNVTGGTARSFSYDTNGNTLSDSLRTYRWDAEDRLVKITQGVNVYEFTYDGLSRKVAEKVNGTMTRRWLWDGAQIAEERDVAGTTIKKRYYGQGEQRLGGTDAGNYYYTRDHLGSIREMTDSTAAVRARYDYDPYGKRTKLSGDLDCDFGFTGHYYHASSGLNLTLYRAYDPELGRWLSADPMGEEGGMNLYAYCYGNPLNLYDPNGMWPEWAPGSDSYSWGEYFGDVGDVYAGEAKGAAENLSFGLYKPCYENDMQSAGGVIGDYAATAATLATGVGGGLKAAGTKGAGKAFSHWIPDRILKKSGSNFIRNTFGKSLLNGNYVSKARHALHDDWARRFMSKAWKSSNPQWSRLMQQLDRLPRAPIGAAAGAAAAAGGHASNSAGSCP